MKKSIITVAFLLTILSLTCTMFPAVSSQVDSVKILNYSWYIDSAGFLDAVGEIQNTGSNTISLVVMSGQATTTTGTQVPSSVRAYVQQMLPGQKAPFYMTFYMQSMDQTGLSSSTPSIASVEVAVVSAQTTTSYQYQDLTVTKHQDHIGTGVNDTGVYWVTGTIQNTGSQTATGVRVLGTFYDSKGNVIAVGGYTDEALAASLAPSASKDFVFGAYDFNDTLASATQKIASYALLVQCEGPLLTGTAPQITPGPTTNTSPAPTASSTSPSNTQAATSNPTDASGIGANSGSPSWLIPAIIVIVVAAAVIGAVIAVKKRKRTQTTTAAKKEN